MKKIYTWKLIFSASLCHLNSSAVKIFELSPTTFSINLDFVSKKFHVWLDSKNEGMFLCTPSWNSEIYSIASAIEHNAKIFYLHISVSQNRHVEKSFYLKHYGHDFNQSYWWTSKFSNQWQPRLRKNLSEQRLVVRRRPYGPPLTASRCHH